MDTLKMHSVNKVDENIKKIGALFPNSLTEVIRGYNPDGSAIVEPAIDFDILRQELSKIVVDGPNERYQFTWPDKRKSILLANAPIAKTLRPCREESVNFDTTENLYIEGDNLDALKILQETYLGKVKMIYIDPPYNTGSDFVYEDDFSQNTDEYLANSGQFDEDGNRLVQNTESNGRFHTDWLNMMYPRLKLAKELLTDDGVIFISIDDNEVDNLEKICNEIFGSSNHVANIIWQKKYAVSNDDPGIASMHEYILAYRKTKAFRRNLLPRTNKQLVRYKNIDSDTRGEWSSDNYISNKSRFERPTLWYPIVHPKTGKEVWPDENAVWRYSKEKHEQIVRENRLYWGPDETYERPRIKRFLSEIQQGIVPSTWWKFEDVGHTDEAVKETGLIMGKKVFPTPKPIRLLKQLLFLGSDGEDCILDFFSGSSATAHAVMQLNAEDGGHRKFIMVQLPEETDEKSEAYKAGYKNICEIGKERIRRAGKKIADEIAQTNSQLKLGEDRKIPDIGFRVLKVDSTNMQDVYYNPSQYKQEQLGLFADNIKPDRSPEDLLFQVMLDLGILLSSKIEETEIAGKKVFSVAKGYLMACFDSSITDDVVTQIAKQKPYYAVFRDSGMASDSVATNFNQIFATYSPTTVRKVL